VDFEGRGSVLIYLLLEGVVAARVASSRDLGLDSRIRILMFEVHLNFIRGFNSNRKLNTENFYVNDQPVNTL
jgi:hypothetical protein